MRSRVIVTVAALGVIGCIGFAVPGVVTAAQDYSLGPLVQRGFAINPVRLNLRQKNRRLVGIGSYLVNSASSCAECHTNPSHQVGGDPYLGERERVNKVNFLAGGARFGPFTSTNLTPDATGKPGGLTYEEFSQRMRTGMTPNHPQFGPFIQVMPWPNYSQMRETELRSIYEYLRSVPHAEPASSE
jgi:hypothetical protein